ncbi:TPA: transcription-repair coupling factor, partial [Streptococcus agalactiae]
AFDSETQRSHENMDQVEIYPASDFILMPWEFEQGVKKLSAQLQNVTDPTAQSYFEEVIAAAENHYYHKELRKFAEYFYEKPASLLNYFPKNIQIFIDDFQKINEANNKTEQELAEFIVSEKSMGRSFEGQTYL